MLVIIIMILFFIITTSVIFIVLITLSITLWNKGINRKTSILEYFIMTSILISKCYFRMARAQMLAGGSRGMTDVQTHWTTRTLTLNRDPTGNMTLNYDIWIMSLNFENTSEMCTITKLTFYYDLWFFALMFTFSCV